MLRSAGPRAPHRSAVRVTGRRLLAALAVPVLLLATACGSEDDDAVKDARIKVTGKMGEPPKISVQVEGEVPDKRTVRTLVEGDGRKVRKGDFVRLDFSGKTVQGKKSLGGTWETAEKLGGDGPRRQLVARVGQPNQELPTQVLDAVVGARTGSRLEVTGTARALVGDQLNPQSGLGPADGLVFVIDVVGAEQLDLKSTVRGEQQPTEDDMPTVAAEGRKAATITVPKGQQPPKKLREQVLVEGDGPKIKAGDGLIAQYTGVKWEDGEKFDSSWDNNGATAFQIGTGSVIKGWDEALVGKRVGDRVLLVIPAKLAYGANPQHELAKNTLVFVVDIVGRV